MVSGGALQSGATRYSNQAMVSRGVVTAVTTFEVASTGVNAPIITTAGAMSDDELPHAVGSSQVDFMFQHSRLVC